MNSSIQIKTVLHHGYRRYSPYVVNQLLSIVVVEETSPVLLSLTYSIRCLIATCLLLSLLIGSFFKFFLYRFIFVSSKLNNGSYLKMTPINSLILISAIIHHLTHLISGVSLAMIIGTDILPEQVFGTGCCKMIFMIGVFGLIHLVVDGLGIAVYRLFCIKSSALVRGQLEEKQLYRSIMFGCPAISAILTMMFCYGNTSDCVMINLCTRNSEFVTGTLLDYSRSQGLETEETSKLYKISAMSILVGMSLMEFTCYLLFFHNVFKNDNGNIKKLLPKEVTRQRNQRNAITFVGQVYVFIVEFAFMVGSLILHLKSNMIVKEVGTVLKVMEFGVLSAVEVLTSASIRQSIFGEVKLG